MKLSEQIAIDDATDTVVAFGVRMTGELLRAFTEPSPEGVWFRVVKRDDDVVDVEMANGGSRAGVRH